MNELGMQGLIVDEVRRCGGFACKMNNRFLAGVVDLLIKLPAYPAGVLEVKQRDRPRDEGLKWKLDVTVLQERYLRDAHAAGMPSGVASFTHKRGSGLLSNRLRLLVLTYKDCVRRDWVVEAHEHGPVAIDAKSDWSIEEHLTAWLGRCAREKK